jgi:glutathione S-transferase
VRETLSILDLEVDVYPCPKRGSRFRPGVVERGGREQFPYLIDAGAGVELYESDAIIAYLFANYGAGPAPLSYRLGPLTDVAAVLAGAPRAARGVFARPSQRPERPLELWSFESSPACRLVREKLCELEIPYVLHNAARGSDRRAQPAGGRAEAELPRLFDPNGKWLLMGTRAIQGHLEQRYAREL